jgi:hypothetical protein
LRADGGLAYARVDETPIKAKPSDRWSVVMFEKYFNATSGLAHP